MNPQLQTAVDLLKTERVQVILILLFVVLSAFLMINFVVLPQMEKKEESQNMRQKMETDRFASQSFANMQVLADRERANLSTLSNEWLRIAERLSSFQNQASVPSGGDRIIDYKVEYYEIRDRLLKKSGELKIALIPTELGIDGMLKSDDDPRTRMMQLKAVELLADLTLDRQIQQLVEIYPLAPIQHVDKGGQKTFTELPVRVECDVDFTHLYSFFQSVFEEDHVFTFRNLRIESGPTLDSKLRVKAILSALLFE